MRSVPSWDDNIFAPVAAVVAAVTALFSGHVIYRQDPHPVVQQAPVDTAPSETGGDTDRVSPDVVTQPSTDPPDRLCDQVLTKEGDVDAMNAQIGDILEEVKARDTQRRK